MVILNKNSKWHCLFINSYLLIFAIWLIITFLQTTMFKINYPNFIQIVLLEITIIFCGIKIILIDKLGRTEESWFCIFLIVSFGGTFINSGYVFLLPVLFLILGAKNVPFKKLIQIYCLISGTLLIITVIASQIGIIENLIYERNGQRISFGFNYPTDFTAHIFFFVMGYCYLRKEKLTYLELVCILGLSAASYIFCNARTNSICLFLTFAVFLYLKISSKISDKYCTLRIIIHKFRKFLIFSIPICALLIIIMTVLYYVHPDNFFISFFDTLFSHRLRTGAIGLEQYGIGLFGSSFQMFGFGGTTIPPKEPFFLDSSYILILIRYGVLVFMCVNCIFVLSSLRAEKHSDMILLYILSLIAIQCMIEHHLLEIAYNPFLFLAFSEIYNKE